MADPTPLIWYSTSTVGTASPSWTDATADLREYSTSRGRESEMSVVDPGRATIVLNDRARTYDPDFNSAIRPMNRWWIREVYSGGTYDVFYGYAEAYQEEWVAGADEARTVVSCVDEMKLLNQARLPTMNPPRDTYADVVLFDQPQGYWRFNSLDSLVLPATAGSQSLATGNFSRVATPIVGDWPVEEWNHFNSFYGARSTTDRIYTIDSSTLLPGLDVGGPGDMQNQTAFTVEFWFWTNNAAPGSTMPVVTGPLSGGAPTYGLNLVSTGLYWYVRNSGGTAYQTTTNYAISSSTWYHVALVFESPYVLLYVNGVEVASNGSFGGSIGAMDAGGYLMFGSSGAGHTKAFDEPAVYLYRLSASRLIAHYQAGTLRGFPAQDPGTRIEAVLDAVGSNAAQSIRAGSRELTPVFMRGQPALEELRVAEEGEAVDAVLFVAADGTITFLDDGHRSVSPWSTVQATFDDTSSEWWYQDIGVDYSDSFIANEWYVTREGGWTYEAFGTASRTQYGPHTASITGLKITTDADAAAIAAAMLAKYQDPMRRVTRIEKLATTSAVITNLLQREIGDRVRIIRHPPGGGSAKDQTAFIQKIEVTAEPGRPRRFVFSVSHL